MSRPNRRQAYRVSEAPEDEAALDSVDAEAVQTIELREEQLIAHKELRTLGEVEVRTEWDLVPGRLEVDAYREEVEVEHEPVGQVVSERGQSWEENGVLIVPIYEEQLVVTKRLVLRERLRIRRVGTSERQLFEDTLRRERLVVEDPQHTGMVHERYSAGEAASEVTADKDSAGGHDAESDKEPEGGFVGQLVRKVLQ
jgi:uncharacterized protein (TIGR02271 family)